MGIYISDHETEFLPHKSLREPPICFETSYLHGAIFYLPKGEKGGDSFIVKEDRGVVISLVCDMQGHGQEARQKLVPRLKKLESIVDATVASAFTEVADHLLELDQQVDHHSLITLSIAKVEPQGSAYLLNEGENKLFLYKKGQVHDASRQLSHGKIGAYRLLPHYNQLVERLVPQPEQLSPGDRLLICTDGVIEYRGSDPKYTTPIIEGLKSVLATASNSAEVITTININPQMWKRARKQALPDDYTAICIEIK